MRTKIDSLGPDPFLGWDDEKVKAYIESKPLAAGDLMIIANSQGGFFEYLLTKVEKPDHGRQKRVILSHAGNFGGASFYRSGKNCFAPTSQTRMIPPTDALMAHLKEPGDRVEIAQRYGKF